MQKKNPRQSDAGVRTQLEYATRLRDDGRLDEAEEILSRLMAENLENPEHLAVGLVRAGILFNLQRFSEAAALFQAIVKEKPYSDLASRGLFHSLWKLGKHDEAFGEMKRFLSISKSDAYDQLLQDLKADLARS